MCVGPDISRTEAEIEKTESLSQTQLLTSRLRFLARFNFLLVLTSESLCCQKCNREQVTYLTSLCLIFLYVK